jgi:hypothetical protein
LRRYGIEATAPGEGAAIDKSIEWYFKDGGSESERVCDVGILPEVAWYLVVNSNIDKGGSFVVRVPVFVFFVNAAVGFIEVELRGCSKLGLDQAIEIQNVGLLLVFKKIKRRTTVQSDFNQDGVIELLAGFNGWYKGRERRGNWRLFEGKFNDGRNRERQARSDTVMNRVADIFEIDHDFGAKRAENAVSNIAWEGFPRRHRCEGNGQQETGEWKSKGGAHDERRGVREAGTRIGSRDQIVANACPAAYPCSP